MDTVIGPFGESPRPAVLRQDAKNRRDRTSTIPASARRARSIAFAHRDNGGRRAKRRLPGPPFTTFRGGLSGLMINVTSGPSFVRTFGQHQPRPLANRH